MDDTAPSLGARAGGHGRSGHSRSGDTGEDDIAAKMDEIRAYVARAKGMPMSATVMVNRSEILALLDELADVVADALTESRSVVAIRNSVIDEGQQTVDEMISRAERERDRILSDTEIFRLGKREAERIVEEARSEAEGLQKDADDYVDGKLANFEVTLERTLEAVKRGRERLLGRSALDSLGAADVDRIRLPEGHEEA